MIFIIVRKTHTISPLLCFYNTLFRAFFHAGSTADTLFGINDRMKIFYFHSIMLTIFHANSAANASCGTGFHSDRSLVGRTAGYLHRIGIWDQTDQVFRTYLYTFSAGLTLLFVYYGYTVLT